MGQVHIANRSDKAPATKGIDAWTFQGYNHVPRIALSAYRSSASQSMTNPRDGASQLLNASPAKHFNESISQKQQEDLHFRLCRVSTILATSSTMLSKTRKESLRLISGCSDPGDTEGLTFIDENNETLLFNFVKPLTLMMLIIMYHH